MVRDPQVAAALATQVLLADLAIDYTREDFAARGETYDVIFVAVDRASFADCLRVLAPGGIYLNVTTPVRTLD